MKYKLLICATEYYPYGSGIANVAYNVVEQLKKMGVDCTICSPTGPDIKLGSSKLIKKSGIIGLLYYWYQVSKYFKDSGYDAAWLHNPLFIGKSPFKNVLVTMNATAYGQVINKIYPLHLHIYKIISSKIEKYCLNNIKDESNFTGVGNNICSELKKIGIDEQKVIYIPNGVNIEKFKPSNQKKQLREKFGIPKDSMVLLSIGRLTEQKDPIKLIDTFYLINKKINNTTLVISGRGEILNVVKKYVDEKKLKNILLLGYVDEKLKPDLYACADYFITSSKYEGGEPPLTISEAMASGLPCIVSNIRNFEIIRDSKCGLVIEFSAIEKCIDKIIDYLERDNYNDSMNARQFAIEKLNWSVIAAKYLEQYKKSNM